MLKIALVDDHQIVRQGFRQLIEIEPDMQVVAEFGSFHQAMDGLGPNGLGPNGLDSNELDICVVDISLSDGNGMELAKHLKTEMPAISVIILSMYEQPHYISEAFNLGISAYLTKRHASDTLIDALHTVAQGDRYFADDILAKLAPEHGNESVDMITSLTEREREVFDLMVKGKEVKKIALILDIAIKTAHTHRRNAMNKLKLRNSFEATQFALKHGLVDADSLHQ